MRRPSAICYGLSAICIFSVGSFVGYAAESSRDPNRIAGYIFGQPVPAGNYDFAKRVASLFPRPWEEQASPEQRERAIWDALILHFESFRRKITVSDEALTTRIDSVLKGDQQSFTRASDPSAYARWTNERLGEDVELFENQMRYLLQIDQLQEAMRTSFNVAVTEEELRQEFLNEQHHVGGEMVSFGDQAAAQAFYEQVKDPKAWDAMKAKGEEKVRPVSLMTLEAYMDLWAIPKGQIYAFHALPIGSVGPPMPFGANEWCVFRLLDKRTGNLAEFPKHRESYVEQITTKKQHEELKKWVENLKASANLQILPLSS
ncbi:MAG: peptidyl-prolyl cis-trans isomerase [Candidatus Omnitrophica bacterium]|nr:peptidyl-prolyl cis-trans isomerase [Candidatus Omnitrophota bacterium]